MDVGDWLALGMVPGLRAGEVHRLVAALGGPAAVLGAGAETLERLGVPGRVAERMRDARAAAVRECETAARHGARVVTFGDDEYPELLRSIADPPPVLFVAGRGRPWAEPAVAIVGARRASAYGRSVAERLGADLATAGFAVVSGLAAGIDAAAHRGALAGGGATIAVMGTGIDVVYPAWHRGLARSIRGQGVLVTEFVGGTPGRPHHFPQRNRIVSGLALGVIVVEAASRSGSLITARLALEQNRQVFAVPGRVGETLHAGAHELIRAGAVLVRRAEDVVEELAPQALPILQHAREEAELASLSSTESKIMDALRHGDADLETLVITTKLPVGVISGDLLSLEIRGLIGQIAGKRFHRRAA